MQHYSIRILETIEHRLVQCDSREALFECCESLTKAIKARNFIYHNYLPVLNETNSIHNFGNNEWISRYKGRNYKKIDPRISYATRNSEPVAWKNIPCSEGAHGVEEAQMMEDAAAHGFGDGYSFPVHAAGSELAVLSVSHYTGQLPEYRDIELSLLALFAHKLHSKFRTVRLAGTQTDECKQELTRRETECIQWAIEGKTSWEISQILGCAESTVIFHMRNVLKKVDASNRIQAAAKIVGQARIIPTQNWMVVPSQASL